MYKYLYSLGTLYMSSWVNLLRPWGYLAFAAYMYTMQWLDTKNQTRVCYSDSVCQMKSRLWRHPETNFRY